MDYMVVLMVGFLMVMLAIVVPLGLFLSLSGDIKLIARDINSIARFLENPPPLEMRTSMMDLPAGRSEKCAKPYTGENYL